MLRSLYTGVSGLINHQTRMDVIGHNVSNVNTTGFKKERVIFQDMLSQMLNGSAKPEENRGGINSKQVGLGMNVASIDKIMTQGSAQSTGKNTDLMISGNGFFVQKQGEKTFFTRAGNFGIDAEGTLVNPANGFKIQGWSKEVLADGSSVINTSEEVNDIIIPVNGKTGAKATQNLHLFSNLNANTEIAVDPNNVTDAERQRGLVHSTSIIAYDAQGGEHKVNLEFNRVAKNRWRAVATVDGALEGSVQTDVGNPTEGTNNTFFINFDNRGTLAGVEDGAGGAPDNLNAGSLIVNLSFNVDNGILDAAGNPVGEQQTIQMNLGTVGQLDGMSQFEAPTTTRIDSQDGYTMGYLESFQVDNAGTVIGVYSNGNREELAKIALASFTNPEGLEKSGDTNFVQSANSGIANIGSAGEVGRGSIIAGALEMSNVDLSKEFTDMITTQRGFQANSRTITTSDTLLEEVLRLKN